MRQRVGTVWTFHHRKNITLGAQMTVFVAQESGFFPQAPGFGFGRGHRSWNPEPNRAAQRVAREVKTSGPAPLAERALARTRPRSSPSTPGRAALADEYSGAGHGEASGGREAVVTGDHYAGVRRHARGSPPPLSKSGSDPRRKVNAFLPDRPTRRGRPAARPDGNDVRGGAAGLRPSPLAGPPVLPPPRSSPAGP